MRLPAFGSTDTLYAVQRRPHGAQAGIIAAHLFAPVRPAGGFPAGRAVRGATRCRPVPALRGGNSSGETGDVDVKRRRSNDLSTKAASGTASVPIAVVCWFPPRTRPRRAGFWPTPMTLPRRPTNRLRGAPAGTSGRTWPRGSAAGQAASVWSHVG